MSLQDILRTRADVLRSELFDLLRIPSVSARSEHADDVRRAGQWVVDHLAGSGMDARLVETDGHPVAMGSWRGAGPGRPTLLVYGHHDVQPAEPLELWTSPPFEPEVRDGRIWARGAADDKGQLYLHLAAIRLLMETRGELPVNVVVVAEGEEEVGSEHLLPFVEAHREELDSDVIVISDSAMFAPGVPSLLLSLRGMAYTEIRVRGARSDLHSGAYGGAVPNPATELARILATLHDDEGRIAIEGFHEGIVEWDEEVLRGFDDLPFSDETFRQSVGAPRLWGEAGRSTLERLWTRPTCEVNGLLSGYTGEGAKTVLPSEAMAKVSFRLVPDQEPDRITELLRRHVARVASPSVAVEVLDIHGGRPWRATPGGPGFEAARTALAETFGTEPVVTGEGGSIPIVAEFERILGARAVLLGFALPGANMHAPDEWFPDDHVEKGIRTLVRFYEELGAPG